jgi:hypothetical protein
MRCPVISDETTTAPFICDCPEEAGYMVAISRDAVRSIDCMISADD